VKNVSPVLSLFLLVGCGGNAPTTVLALEGGGSCPQASGSYDAVFMLTAKEGGACTKAKQVSYDTLSFDGSGQFISPASAVLPCTTTQVDCQIAVRCDSVFASAHFDGTLTEDGDSISGSAQLRGAVSDCDKMTYAMEAARPLPDESSDP
jgi:hypothetical protein